MNNLYIKNVYIIKKNVLSNPYNLVFRKKDINVKDELIKEIKINNTFGKLEIKRFLYNIYKELEILNQKFNKKREKEKKKEKKQEKKCFKHFEIDLKPIEKRKISLYKRLYNKICLKIEDLEFKIFLYLNKL